MAIVYFFLQRDQSGMSILTNSMVDEETRIATLKDIIRKQSPNKMKSEEIDRLAGLAAPKLLKQHAFMLSFS